MSPPMTANPPRTDEGVDALLKRLTRGGTGETARMPTPLEREAAGALSTALDDADSWRRVAERCEREAAAATERAERAEAAIAWANNSLFGSHGFFLSLNGGEPDDHHLDRAIEDLKTQTRKQYAELARLRSEVERKDAALRLIVDLGAGPGLSNEDVAELIDRAARAALQPKEPQ